jgi:hypothetical protein
VTPATYNLTVQAGDPYRLVVLVEDGDGDPLQADGWASQIRQGFLPQGVLKAAFTVTVDPETYAVTLELDGEETAALSGARGLVWDLESITAGEASTWLTGDVSVLGQVTEVAS